MEKFTSIMDKKEELITEAVDPMLINFFKKFGSEDLMTYLKGLLTKYMDMYEVKKLLPKLDKPKDYNDFMFVYTKIVGHLKGSEKARFTLMKKLLKDYYDKKYEVDKKPAEDKKKEAEKAEEKGGK